VVYIGDDKTDFRSTEYSLSLRRSYGPIWDWI